MAKTGTGCLIAVVGASGVGKDSLMEGARQMLSDCHFVQRIITRPADAGAEDHIAATEEEFSDSRRRGDLLFDWTAHGLRYGIPIQARDLYLQGHTVIFNGSRNALAAQCAAWPDLGIIWVTASHAIRAKRLALRGREDEEAIAERLSVEGLDIPHGAVMVENEASLDAGVQAMIAAIRSLSGAPCTEPSQ